MFRSAKDSDIADLVELTLDFCRKTPIGQTSEPSVEKITNIYLTYIVDGKGIVWVLEEKGEITAFIAGHVGELAFSTEKSGQVQCWWVKDKRRIRENGEHLLDLFQMFAHSQGASTIVISSLFNKTVEEIYKDEHYKPYETIFIKEIR